MLCHDALQVVLFCDFGFILLLAHTSRLYQRVENRSKFIKGDISSFLFKIVLCLKVDAVVVASFIQSDINIALKTKTFYCQYEGSWKSRARLTPEGELR